jgi:ATP-dependent 26S proteasome regulatory subunit
VQAPLSPQIEFEELGRRFDFTSGTISSAVVRAAAKAALRLGEKHVIGQKDLVEAAEAEKAHSRDEVNEIMLRAFL